jgi:Zn-dependent protease with chaperone function
VLLAGGGAAVVSVAAFGVDAVSLLLLLAAFAASQWLVAPWLLGWMLRPRWIPRGDGHYVPGESAADRRVAFIVARRCESAGLPLVRLGVVDVDAPNAFTYGRSQRSARVVVTSGLLHRLDDEELDAVICHELGHVRHRDALVMTVLAVIPMALYLVGRSFLEDDDDDDDEGSAVLLGIAVLVAYLVVELLLLSFNRSREHAADRWACEHTGDGDALASALVKVVHAVPSRTAVRAGSDARDAGRTERRLAAAGAMGLRDCDWAETPEAVPTHDELVVSYREELARRRRVTEFLSTHPSVARRIAALEASGLPGAPRRWRLTTDPGALVSQAGATESTDG